jgi:hypothetical protein
VRNAAIWPRVAEPSGQSSSELAEQPRYSTSMAPYMPPWPEPQTRVQAKL